MNYNTILHELSLNMNCRLHIAQDISYKIHIAHDTSNASIFFTIFLHTLRIRPLKLGVYSKFLAILELSC